MKRHIFIIILLCWHTIALANITMNIEPATARPGETLRLTLTQSDDPQFHGVPDLTPLKKEFTLVGTEHSMSYTANNGIAKSENQWVVLLIPKKSGILSIPAIKIGQQYSHAGQVNITTSANSPIDDSQAESQAESLEEHNAVTLHTEVDQEKPFINQQIIYTVKLSTSQTLLEAQYQPPSVENALLIPLGDGRRYQTTINGQEYSIDEQKYAIYPQKSGEVRITPPKITAVVYDTIPERVNVEGNTIELMVKPVPKKNTTKPWLPAKQVTLSEHYDSSKPTMSQGTTLVRRITLRAMGLPAELLPTLTFADSKQYNVYPEKPDTRNVLRQQELIGTSAVTVTYILNQSGHITLPSIEIPWFNTQTGQDEMTTLPSRDITVTGKADANPAPLSSTPEKSHNTNTDPKLSSLPAPNTNNQSHPLAWWIAAGFALAWIMTLGLWWTFRNRPARPKLDMQSTLTRLRKSCTTNNPEQAHAALLNWSRQQWPDAALLNLSELSKLVRDIALQKQITLLSQALYAQNGLSDWRGDALWHAIKAYRPKKSTQKTPRNPLPPINP